MADDRREASALARLLFHLSRLRIDPAFAFLHLVTALRQMPPVTTVRLSAAQLRSVISEGSISEKDIHRAEESVASGDFTFELLGQVLIGLASSFGDGEVKELLGIDRSSVDKLYDDGRLIGRTAGGVTATPSWLFDTAQPDGLIPHSKEVLAADSPLYNTSFGQSIYRPMPTLRTRAPLSPRAWLSEGHDPSAVVAFIESATKDRA